MRKKILILILSILVFSLNSYAQENSAAPRRGVWVTVFSVKKVLYSKAAVLELIDTCKKANLNEIYLQVYQSGKAFYDSQLTDRSKYEDIIRSAGQDTIELLISEAAKNNIKVFAWVNLLSLGQNYAADIIQRFGDEVLTADQYSRPSGRKETHALDSYYLREDQLFLEPGDPRVGKYLLLIVDEILKRYPDFSGVHLDYVRYPMTVPFIPGSRFNKFGLSYGYGRKNVARFRDWTAIDPLKGLSSEEKCLKWDNWKRDQVTGLVRRIARHVKSRPKGYLISCAVAPSYERAYSSLFQDWVYWVGEGIIDYVILMNYSQDNRLTQEIGDSVSCLRKNAKIYMGIGLFLLKDNPDALRQQYDIAKSSGCDGIAIFSYDDINKTAQDTLRSLP